MLSERLRCLVRLVTLSSLLSWILYAIGVKVVGCVTITLSDVEVEHLLVHCIAPQCDVVLSVRGLSLHGQGARYAGWPHIRYSLSGVRRVGKSVALLPC